MRGRKAGVLARDSSSTWTRATRSLIPGRGGGAPGRSRSRATKSSCRFSPCGGARNSSLSSQSISVNSNRGAQSGKKHKKKPSKNSSGFWFLAPFLLRHFESSISGQDLQKRVVINGFHKMMIEASVARTLQDRPPGHIPRSRRSPNLCNTRVRGVARMRSYPSIPGKPMSIRMKSGVNSSTTARASLPSWAPGPHAPLNSEVARDLVPYRDCRRPQGFVPLPFRLEAPAQWCNRFPMYCVSCLQWGAAPRTCFPIRCLRSGQ